VDLKIHRSLRCCVDYLRPPTEIVRRTPKVGRGSAREPVPDDPRDVLVLLEPAFGLLRRDELVVDRDLEDASRRGDQRQVRDLVLELVQQQLRQTDGSRRVASLGAIFDRDLHHSQCNRAHL
jgi:hypothetical protein